MVRIVIRILICLFFVGIVGCAKEFEELDGPSFKAKWEESAHHSVVSWWYPGEKDHYHYIVESRIRSGGKDIFYYLVLKWFGDEYYYKVNKKYVEVVLDKPKNFTLDEDQWLNLKTRHIKFKD